MNPQQIKDLLFKTALQYFKLYNLQEQDIIIVNGFIQEVLCQLDETEEGN